MKNIILTYEGYHYTNIGDYIQSLAACQFMNSDKVVYCHRDELSLYKGEEAKVIMNGWFTHKPQNWPPAPQVLPLFVSFHLNISADEQILSDKGIAYLKQHEPIGCRDKSTVDRLREKGIKAYFSSCLTTTFGYQYKTNNKRKGIYIVDPVHYVPEASRRFQKYKFLLYYLAHLRGINKYIRNIKLHNRFLLSLNKDGQNRYACLIRSYTIVRQLLSKNDIEKAVVLTQYHYSNEYPTDKERFERANELLTTYASAELVITSRIHCALPCLGLNTPVIFLQNDEDAPESTCRFKGLTDLLNVVHFRKNRITSSPFPLPLQYNEYPTNSDAYKDKALSLIERCKQFMEK